MTEAPTPCLECGRPDRSECACAPYTPSAGEVDALWRILADFGLKQKPTRWERQGGQFRAIYELGPDEEMHIVWGRQ